MHPTFQMKLLPQGGVRFALPRRFGGSVRAFGAFTLLPLLLGFLAIAVMNLLVAAGVVEANVPSERRLGFLPFAVFFGGAAGLMIFYLIPYQFGHSEVAVRNRELQSVERAGPLKHSRCRVALSEVERLVVSPDPVLSRQMGRGFQTSQTGSLVSSIQVDQSGGRSSILIADYPRDLLLPLAEAVAQEVSAGRAAGPEPGKLGPVEVADDTANSALSGQREGPPEDTEVEVVQRSGRLRVSVPPGGAFGGTRGALAAVLVIILAGGILSTILMVVARAATTGEDNVVGGGGLFLLGLLTFLWCLLMMTVLSTLHLGTSRASLNVSGNRLVLNQRSCLGTHQRHWWVQDLRCIRLAASGYRSGSRSNASPQLQLEIEDREGQRYALFPGREEKELEWLGTLLGQQAGIPFESQLADPSLRYAWNRRATAWQPGWPIFAGGLLLGTAAVSLLYLVSGWIAPVVKF